MDAKRCDWCNGYYVREEVENSKYKIILRDSSIEVDVCPGCNKKILGLEKVKVVDTILKSTNKKIVKKSTKKVKSWTILEEKELDIVRKAIKENKTPEQIKNLLPGRSVNAIAIRRYYLSNKGRKSHWKKVKNSKKNNWTIEEENVIKEMAKQGRIDYKELLKKLPGRNIVAIRLRVSILGCALSSAGRKKQGIIGLSDQEYMKRIKKEESETQKKVVLCVSGCGNSALPGEEFCASCQEQLSKIEVTK